MGDVAPEVVLAMKRCVVPLVCMSADGETLVSMAGTAFFTGNGDVLTAAHVYAAVAKLNTPENPCFPAIYFPLEGWEEISTNLLEARWFEIRACKMDEELDIAACHFDSSPLLDPYVRDYAGPVEFENAKQVDGTPVAFTGFPLDIKIPITSKGSVAAYMDFDDETRTAKTLLVDKTGWPGASGSPIYLKNGKVIGMATRTGTGTGAGLAYGVTANQITRFLEGEGKF